METIRTLTYLLILADTTLNRRWIYDHINNQLFNYVPRTLSSSAYNLVHSVENNTSVRLSCPSPRPQTWSPWLLCVWVSPSGRRSCRLQTSSGQLCRHPRGDIVPGPGHSCDMDIGVGLGDHGTWTCMLTMSGDGDYHTIVSRLSLSVTVIPQLR